MKKILFITTFFYPQNRIPTIRVGQWVKYLALNGYEVTVLTTKKYSFMGPFGLDVKLPNNVKVVEIDFLPIFLKKRLYKKPSSEIKKEVSISNKTNNLKLFVRKIRNYMGSLFDIHDLWIKPALKKAIELQEKEKFDFIISSYSPPAVCVVSHKLKQKYPNLKWIADFRDLWAYNHISPAKGILGVYEKYKEKKLLSNADKIITVSNPLTEDMKKVYPNKKVYTIENGFDPDEFSNWQKNINSIPKVGKKLVISYLGTIYPEKRDPTILFEAVNELIEENKIKEEQIEINFYGDNKKQLEDIIQPNNFNKFNIINIKGFIKREESLKIQKQSDLLLLLEWNDPSARGVLTGKLFEYIVSGTPIVAVSISNKNAAGELIEKTQTGKLYLDKDSLKQDLLKIFETNKIDFFNPKIEEIEKFSRDKQIKKLIETMEDRC